MIDPATEEIRLLKTELAHLRQALLRADPTILLDGRFERMIVSPVAVIGVARELVARLPGPAERADDTARRGR